MRGLVVAETLWSTTTATPDETRTTVHAAVIMCKAFAGWWVTARCGPVTATTWHLTFDGARARYDLAEHHTVEAMDRLRDGVELARTGATL